MKTAFFLTVVFIGLTYLAGMLFKQQLRTEITINASPQVVWRHLINFESYPEWNPFIKSISGEFSSGGRLNVTIAPEGKDAMVFKSRLLAVSENRELRWLGKVFIPNLFDGEHYFILEQKTDGSTLLIQGEYFRGMLLPLIWNGIEKSTKNGFEAMNKALKTRAEMSL